MKNEFEIRGDVTAIIINSKFGRMETIIDTADLERAQELQHSWHIALVDKKSFYIMGHHRDDEGLRITVKLHRWLMNTPKGLVVDHINHDTLDNRCSCNLRNVTHAENMQNLRGKSPLNKTSLVRGVGWDKGSKKWKAQACLRGKYIYLGLFETIPEAEEVVKKWRSMHMPCSPEARSMIE